MWGRCSEGLYDLLNAQLRRWRQHPERVVSFYPRLYSADGDQPPVTRKEKVAISRCAAESLDGVVAVAQV